MQILCSKPATERGNESRISDEKDIAGQKKHFMLRDRVTLFLRPPRLLSKPKLSVLIIGSIIVKSETLST
ncbi:hypothetical protein LCGC14_1010890 [marine sediment metagenome]|uniref:Uncharacterized protein n=1 Tax=marine sediment metagenome TaxID=412755 RepID=A0A0F9QIK3_9ZZZZ